MATEKRLIDANKIPYHKSGFPKGDGFDSGKDWAFREDIDKLPTVDAVEATRLGKLGQLMMPYRGCPRGAMGPRGFTDNEEKLMELEPIVDIDGNHWVPVLEDDLNDLKAQVKDAVEVVRCKECRWARPQDHREPIATPAQALICECFMHHHIPAPWGARLAVKPDDFCSYGERRTDG